MQRDRDLTQRRKEAKTQRRTGANFCVEVLFFAPLPLGVFALKFFTLDAPGGTP
jgi:hypothetical protein